MVKKYEKLISDDFDKTVATWETTVTFSSKKGFAKGDIFVEISTNSDVYAYVNRGTLIRHAVMTSDFQPKTKRNQIESFAGRGEVARVSKGLQLPGIGARNFTIEIRKKHEDDFKDDIKKAIRDGLRAKRGSP